MDVKQAASRALLAAGLLLVAPGLAGCDGDPATGNQEAGDNNSSVQGPASGEAGSGVGQDEGGGSPIMEATGRAEDTGDRAHHGAEEASEGEGGTGEESQESGGGTGE